jgi:iron complex transport system ATP-binding protein
MDPGAREKFLAALGRVGRQRRLPTLIYVTHHIEEILPLFQKTLVLYDGKVIHCGATRNVLAADVLRELYGVSLNVIRRQGRYWPILK